MITLRQASGSPGTEGPNGYDIQYKGEKLTISEMDTTLFKLRELALRNAVGENYIVVSGSGTDIENATELQAAYNKAKTMSPTYNNRITIVVSPGYYKFPLGGFVLDTEYIDLISLTGNRDVKIDLDVEDPWVFNEDYVPSDDIYALRIYADNIYINGFRGAIRESLNWGDWWGDDYVYCSFDIGDDLPNTTIENCAAGPMSFGTITYYEALVNPLEKTISSTFINCQGQDYSFGNGCIVSGYFKGCDGIDDELIPSVSALFSSGCILSGTFIDCGNPDLFSSFGGNWQDPVILSGLFLNCVTDVGFGNGNSATTISGLFQNCTCRVGFGSINSQQNDNVILSGTFINCRGGDNSFGSSQTEFTEFILSGTFINCVAGSNSFGYLLGYSDPEKVELSGTFINCVAQSNSFGSFGVASGNFKNCIGGLSSFGRIASGKFIDCYVRGGDGFGSDVASGTFINCHTDANGFGVSEASGTFINCTTVDFSFGYGDGAVVSGNFTNCVSGASGFGGNLGVNPTIEISGNFTNCVSGAQSFGGTSTNATLTGKLYYCRLTSGTFPTVSTGGRTIYCIDGNNNTNNQ
jgi:hypothetical protein